ncbi:cytochrome P450 [Nocardiopsis coralliicola]
MLRTPPPIDQTAALLSQGYLWLPGLFRGADEPPALATRLFGRRAVAVRDPGPARAFSDEQRVRRAGTLPEPVRSTLTGHGSVHGLDGDAHRSRKALFSVLLHRPGDLADLVGAFTEAWRDATAPAAAGHRVTVFGTSARALTRSACRWAGVPLARGLEPRLAADLVAMVDAFATPAPRHWRGRSARRRWERRLGQLVAEVRAGGLPAAPGSPLRAVSEHRDSDGTLLDEHTAAVELLNLLRPVVAVSFYAAFTAHAAASVPGVHDRLRDAPGESAPGIAQEVRRFYPIAPFLGGTAVSPGEWGGVAADTGTLILLDVYGRHHDPRLWEAPQEFRPERFGNGAAPGDDLLLPQGRGDERSGHRCPGEDAVLALLNAFGAELGRMRADFPDQDLRIPLRRIPTRPRSGVAIELRR